MCFDTSMLQEKGYASTLIIGFSEQVVVRALQSNEKEA